MSARPIKLAVLVSGGGTTLQNLLDQIADGKLDARIELVIGSRPGLRGLQRAIDAGIPCKVIDRRAFDTVESFSSAVFEAIDNAAVDLVVLAGWLCLLKLSEKYNGRVINIHPALLPDFGGKGMFGRHVHEAVLRAGCRKSGCTIHFVDNTYDTGPIILQRTCDVVPGDTPETLAARVFEEEKLAYPEAIQLFASGKLRSR